MQNLFDNNSGNEFSPCRKYRYKLWRIWNNDLPIAMCIGLNPSNATGTKDDPTIRILRKMLSGLGFGGFYMTNLYAIISPDPRILKSGTDPMGENKSKLIEVAQMCDEVVFCWGNFKSAADRIKEVEPQFPNAKCFGFNDNGTPLHPLAMQPRNGRNPKDAALIPYNKTTPMP